jgi:hypothetical protein
MMSRPQEDIRVLEALPGLATPWVPTLSALNKYRRDST